MVSTADLISGFVALRSTRKVNNWFESCDSSLAASAFSVITGDLMMSQTVLIVRPPPRSSVYVCASAWPALLPRLPVQSRPPPLCVNRATARVPAQPTAITPDDRDKADRRCLDQSC